MPQLYAVCDVYEQTMLEHFEAADPALGFFFWAAAQKRPLNAYKDGLDLHRVPEGVDPSLPFPLTPLPDDLGDIILRVRGGVVLDEKKRVRRPPVPRAERMAGIEPDFASALAACGLSQREAVQLFCWNESSVEKKSRGVVAMMPDEAAALIRLYKRIQLGDVADLPVGCQRMSATLRLLRGAEAIRKPVRRKRRTKAEMEAAA